MMYAPAEKIEGLHATQRFGGDLEHSIFQSMSSRAMHAAADQCCICKAQHLHLNVVIHQVKTTRVVSGNFLPACVLYANL